MSSIPCPTHQSASFVTDLQALLQTHSRNPLIALTSSSTTKKTVLKFFNARVTQRLHRYRSMKKQWQGGAPPDVPDVTKAFVLANPKSLTEPRGSCTSDSLCTAMTVRDMREKSSSESNLLNARIQQDLVKLRRFTNHKRKDGDDHVSFVSMTSSRPLGDTVSSCLGRVELRCRQTSLIACDTLNVNAQEMH